MKKLSDNFFISFLLWTIILLVGLAIGLIWMFLPHLLLMVGFLTTPCTLIAIPLLLYEVKKIENGRKRTAAEFRFFIGLCAPYIISMFGFLLSLIAQHSGFIEAPSRGFTLLKSIIFSPSAILFYLPFLYILQHIFIHFSKQSKLLLFISPVIFFFFIFGPSLLLYREKTMYTDIFERFFLPCLYVGYMVLGFYFIMHDIARKRHWIAD